MKRVFFALNIPAETKRALGEFIAAFSPNYRNTDIRWVSEENLHITLHFLGDQDDRTIEKLKTMARAIAEQTKKFFLYTREISAFPNLHMARIIFLETHNNPVVKTMVQQLKKQLQMAKFEIDQRPWHAHITIGRGRDGAPIKLPPFDEHEIPFTSFELMQSELGPKGPTYRILESFELQ